MGIVLSITLILVLVTIIILAVLWTAWKPKAHNTADLNGDLPQIAILIAVRDEILTIEATIQSLLLLEYPKTHLKIIFGDDGSSDGSTEIIKEFVSAHDYFQYVRIEQDENASDKAKAFVLGELAKRTAAEYLMFTDGDIQVPPTWIKKHLACLKEDTGIQSGFTLIRKTGFFSSMQMIDWSFALGMVKIVSGWGIPVTAVGNNMIIKKSTYDEVGGFENLPFSVTEDFAIFKQIVKKGYGFQQLANEDSLAFSAPATSLKSLLQQRKRWMVGAMQLPLTMRALLFIQAFYYLAVIVLLIYNPLVGIPLFGLKTTIQSLFINKIHERLGQYMPIGHLFIFEFYSAFLTIILCVYYLLPLPVVWKGRKLKNK